MDMSKFHDVIKKTAEIILDKENQIVNTVERVNQSYKSKPIKLHLYDTHIHVLRHDSHCILTAKLITIQTDLT